MKSIKSVYKIGNGPSSSHTVGPYSAAELMEKRYPDADRFEVTLYGSLAATGEGHSTKKAILEGSPKAEVFFDREEKNLPHPNTMLFRVMKDGREIDRKRILSIGGGSIRIEGEENDEEREVYAERNFSEILNRCKEKGETLLEYIYGHESESLRPYLITIWHTMEQAVRRGLKADGILPGGLGVSRKAKSLYEKRCYNEDSEISMNRIVSAYAFAMSEENACEHLVVTAPTCGSCGVIPAVLYYMRYDRGFPEEEIIDALAVAGLIGNVIRTNASISGAECGCQAEIGSACSMAAAGLAALNKMSLEEIEYSAEVAMEHNLGLTCDPVDGLVQIPCIERNSVAALRAMNCVSLAHFLTETRKISFDEVLETMYRTGLDMDERYKETSHGGLAVMHQERGN